MVTTNSMTDARDRVVQYAREIEHLSRSGVSEQAFFTQFLERLVSALGAPAGAVWTLEGGNRLSLLTEVGLAGVGFDENPQAHSRNQQLLVDVLNSGRSRVASPDDPNSGQVPSNHVIILETVQKNSSHAGVVEIFQRPNTPHQARPGYLQFVEQMCGYATRFLSEENNHSEPVKTSSVFWERFEQFVLQLQRSLDVDEVATTAVNDGRKVLDCDRLSIAVQRGTKISIRAVSGHGKVNRRANLVRLMSNLASKVMAMKETLTYSGKLENLPPQVEEPLADFLQESESRMIIVVPLFKPEPLINQDEDESQVRSSEKRQQVIGGLIVEQISESRPKPDLLERLDLCADHVSAALSNAQTHQNMFLQPLWRFLGKTAERMHGRTLAKTVTALTLLAGVVLAMILVPYEYRVEGGGRLMPIIQRQVFANWDGEVVEIFAEGGQRVEAGQKLLQLRNDDLHAKLLATRNQRLEKLNLSRTLRNELRAANLDGIQEDIIRLQGRLVATGIEIEGFQEQIRVLEDREAQLTVRAPIAGVVTTFQVDQLLKNRPIRRGEVLLEVMDDTGRWRLELDVPEHRMGHVLRAQHASGTAQLPIEFILATAVESTYPAILDTVGTRSHPAESGTVVEIHAAISDDLLDQSSGGDPTKIHPKIGAEVRAKIGCGDRSLGYVLFGDVIEFLQKQFWL